MFYFGAQYHPEMFTPERQRYDAQLMREAGFTLVRIGEFAWERMEPSPGDFQFGWLDEAIENLNAHGIQVMLGTPTAGPPTWIGHPRDGQPDCRMVYEDGVRWEAGSRSYCCVRHPFFIERSRLIANALGRHYAGHPGVMGFQIDNELGMFGSRCYCPSCLAGFREWLAAKYGTIETLNARLGMLFGGNEFRDFEDVPLPRRRQDMHNPGLLLDSQRFYSDCNIAFVHTQARALREAGARQPITTNVCHMFSGTDGNAFDYQAMFAELDVAGFDCYPTQFAANPAPATMGLLHAIMRGYKKQRYWMLEQQSGTPDGLLADDPRRSRLWTWQSIAYGAELINYWLWRTHRYGAEQYFRGILDHDGEVNPRYEMVARVGAEIRQLESVLANLHSRNEVAILLDFDSSNSLMLNPPTSGLGHQFYRDHAQMFLAGLQTLGLSADVVFNGTDLARYRLVIAPALRLIDPELAQQLQSYVHQGGTLVTSVLTATLDRDHVAPAERPPYLLKDLLGVERVEWGSLGAITKPPKELSGTNQEAWASMHSSKGEVPVEIKDTGGDGALQGIYSASLWYDQLHPTTAQVLATFSAGSPVAGLPVATHNHAGKGQVFALATVLDKRFYGDLLRTILGEPAGPVRVEQGEPVEIVPVEGDGETMYFVLNHGGDEALLTIEEGFVELFTGQIIAGKLVLGGYDVALLKKSSGYSPGNV